DLDKVFYLLSRGFSEKEAKGLILRGKFLNMLKEVKNQEIVDKFIELLMEAI
ncbi:MAG TPA: SufD family Fe-S cluster assembly protein, partial [Candidatus Dwaynia gallinarum]|nr:SufD family Fe-S cluster assembly protein [Candidatus Dwaynia gallinarum]